MNPSLNTPQLGGPQSNATIRLPMLGHQLAPNHHLHLQQQQSLVQQPQQQQQPQSQQQQQQSQQQQQQQQQQNPPIQPPPPPPPQSGQDFTLSSVLHFLQTEWRRYERDRNEWEIERAEMRARIALLEGERRSFENIRLDLARRIKMLEYALRMERSKQLNTQPQPSTSPTKGSPPKEIQGQKEDSKEDSGSSSPRSDDMPLPDHRLSMSLAGLPNGTHQPNSRPQSWSAPVAMAHQISLASLGKAPPGRDPRSRQRSKEYLKQCLQEITYLTSAHALNPLPNRPLLSNTALPVSMPNLSQYDQAAFNGRPRKILNDNNGIGMGIPPTNIAKPPEQIQQQHVNGVTFPTLANPQGLTQQQNDRAPSVPSHIPLQSHGASTGSQPSTPFPSQPQLNDRGTNDTGADTAQLTATEPLTAIFRPDETWRDQLRRAGQASVRLSEEANPDQIKTVSGAASWDSRSQDDEDDVREDDEDAETEDVSLTDESEGSKVWRVKRMLRNHLDAVRAVAFHSQEMCLATGGDDCTVKIWRLDPQSLSSSTAAKTEIEPQMTLRGHSSPITRLVISSNKQILYSASLDSTICMWHLPPAHTNTYAPYATLCVSTFYGHTDAVWDLVLLRNETLLISSGADGRVLVWDVNSVTSGSQCKPKLSWGYAGLGQEQSDGLSTTQPVAVTALEPVRTQLKTIAVAYRDAVVKLFDVDTGKILQKLQSSTGFDASTSTGQINSLVSHPTMPLLVAGYEDKNIRLFDITTGECTHTIPSHVDSVTSLAIDPTGFLLASGGHDCSVRFWDLLNTRACLQESTSHREKAQEGVLQVAFHPILPFLASAGADGVVKLYAAS